jgi:nucleoside-diphosphate-sugar epimerase
MAKNSPKRRFLVAGGAGYIGSVLTRELLGAGHGVRVLDSLLYGNGASVSALAENPDFSFLHGDVRSPEDASAAMEGVTDVVLLAALVGDPVCKRHPELAKETNVGGARNLLDAAAEADVERLVFASTCSNYGLREGEEAASEDDELHPLSLYAETKVEMEDQILSRADQFPFAATVMRVATAYGISPRMRFDLTISEFTRELALGHELEVYDPDTWRPYCHVADISAAAIAILDSPPEQVRGEVFNVGGDEGNHTKRMVVEAALEALGGDGEVAFTEGGDDARNYKVSFEKIGDRLGFATAHTVRGSIERLISGIRAGLFADVERNGLYHRNFELTEPAAAGEGRGGGDAG